MVHPLKGQTALCPASFWISDSPTGASVNRVAKYRRMVHSLNCISQVFVNTLPANILCTHNQGQLMGGLDGINLHLQIKILDTIILYFKEALETKLDFYAAQQEQGADCFDREWNRDQTRRWSSGSAQQCGIESLRVFIDDNKGFPVSTRWRCWLQWLRIELKFIPAQI